MKDEKYLEELCRKYALPVFENPRDNFLMIIESSTPTKEEKWLSLEIYDNWLLAIHAE